MPRAAAALTQLLKDTYCPGVSAPVWKTRKRARARPASAAPAPAAPPLARRRAAERRAAHERSRQRRAADDAEDNLALDEREKTRRLAHDLVDPGTSASAGARADPRARARARARRARLDAVAAREDDCRADGALVLAAQHEAAKLEARRVAVQLREPQPRARGGPQARRQLEDVAQLLNLRARRRSVLRVLRRRRRIRRRVRVQVRVGVRSVGVGVRTQVRVRVRIVGVCVSVLSVVSLRGPRALSASLSD